MVLLRVHPSAGQAAQSSDSQLEVRKISWGWDKLSALSLMSLGVVVPGTRPGEDAFKMDTFPPNASLNWMRTVVPPWEGKL